MKPRKSVNRRGFLKNSTALAAGASMAGALAAAEERGSFKSDWTVSHDRVWIGPEFWANPLQDWRIANGRVECVNAAADRHLHLLTRSLNEKPGTLSTTVRVGRTDGPLGKGEGSAGFRVGIQGPL